MAAKIVAAAIIPADNSLDADAVRKALISGILADNQGQIDKLERKYGMNTAETSLRGGPDSSNKPNMGNLEGSESVKDNVHDKQGTKSKPSSRSKDKGKE